MLDERGYAAYLFWHPFSEKFALMAFLAFLKQFSTRLFWLAALGVAAWFAFAMFNLSITKAYHPMAFLGSIGAIWFWGFAAFAGMIATARILCYARLEQRRDALDLGAAAVLLLTALLHNLSIGMDSGRTRKPSGSTTFAMRSPGNTRPGHGRRRPSLVKVGTDQLLARYPAREMKYFTLSKSALPEAETAPLLKEPLRI